MFLHDRVSIEGEREIIDYDMYGQPIFGPGTSVKFPAQVDASSSVNGPDDNAEQVISRYRVMLKLPAGYDAQSITAVDWQGRTLTVDGAVQPQMIRGRISHHEFVTERVTG